LKAQRQRPPNTSDAYDSGHAKAHPVQTDEIETGFGLGVTKFLFIRYIESLVHIIGNLYTDVSGCVIMLAAS
jgi:hypothetical protein